MDISDKDLDELQSKALSDAYKVMHHYLRGPEAKRKFQELFYGQGEGFDSRPVQVGPSLIDRIKR